MKNSLLYSLVLTSSLLFADRFYTTSSMQGMSGVINTPTAEVLEDGKVELSYSNQVDLVRLKDDKGHYTADHYIVNFGLLPNLEVMGRLSNIDDKDKPYRHWGGQFIIRDLSASFKYQIPLYHPYLPKVAIGVQDLGGQADHYDAKYIVATKQLGFLRASVGYGIDSINFLDGAFGSMELRATDWLTLMGEYDSSDLQAGIRLNTPNYLSDYVDLSLLAKANLTDDSQRFSFGVNVKMELGDDHHSASPIAPRTNYQSKPLVLKDRVSTKDKKALYDLKEKLVAVGLENIDIADRGETIYVAYENNVFDHNELDALGMVLGEMASLDLPYSKFEVVIKRSNQKVKKVSGDLQAYKKFLFDLDQQSLVAFKSSLQVEAPEFWDGNLDIKGANPSYLKTRIIAYPGLKTYVGTEVGVLDYLVSLRIGAHWNLYKGFDVTFFGDIPAFKSDDLKEGGAFAYADRGEEIKSLLLHRSDTYKNLINIASVGMLGDYYAFMDNLTYSHQNHTLSLKYSYLETKEKKWLVGYDHKLRQQRDIYYATYSYYYDRFDTLFQGTVGKYLNDDEGYELEAKRFFGDTAVGFFYQNADENYIGIRFEIPLTPRKIKDTFVQLKGRKNFTYSLRTTVQDEDGRNTLAPGGLVKPYREFDIESDFLNRNRLSQDYINKHLFRLRDVYMRYRR